MFEKKFLIKKKIFVGFDHAGASGIYAFTRELKKRGYKIDFYGKVKSKFKRPVDVNLDFSGNRFVSLFQAIIYFFTILPKYDIWHFNYGYTFFICPLNLLILKLLGKKIICTFRGNDAVMDFDFLPMRLFKKTSNWPKYYKNLLSSRYGLTLFFNWLRKESFMIFADQIIVIGPFLVGSVRHFDKLIPYTSNYGQTVKNSSKGKIRIFHAPTDSVIKGTEAIKNAFEKLTDKYPHCEFVFKENLSHEEVIHEMSKADIVVDQLLVGWYGEQAAEAMAMGKTIMAFMNPVYFNFVSFAKEIPVINTNYWTFESDLKKLLDYPQQLEKTGRASFEFAKKYHWPDKIGDKYLEAYRDCYK